MVSNACKRRPIVLSTNPHIFSMVLEVEKKGFPSIPTTCYGSMYSLRGQMLHASLHYQEDTRKYLLFFFLRAASSRNGTKKQIATVYIVFLLVMYTIIQNKLFLYKQTQYLQNTVQSNAYFHQCMHTKTLFFENMFCSPLLLKKEK